MKSFYTLLNRGVRLHPGKQNYKEIKDTYTKYSDIVDDNAAQQMLDQHHRLVAALDTFLDS